jgi:hypothetical protein
MSRQETDREDLMREAVALARRVELVCEGEPEPVIAGFRRSGHLAVYFGADPVYQFDEAGRLRRAFIDGDLYRTQGETLARLTRRRTQAETVLDRHDLSADELTDVLTAARSRLERLARLIDSGAARATSRIPADDEALPSDVAAFLTAALNAGLPLAPAIPGKR